MFCNVLSFNKAGLFKNFKIPMMSSSEIQRTVNKWKKIVWHAIILQLTIMTFIFLVNLVHDQQLVGIADMGAHPQKNTWTAAKAIDGGTNQDYSSGSCAITDVVGNRNTSIWWKVWLQNKYNVAYIEIYFRSDSKYLTI